MDKPRNLTEIPSSQAEPGDYAVFQYTTDTPIHEGTLERFTTKEGILGVRDDDAFYPLFWEGHRVWKYGKAPNNLKVYRSDEAAPGGEAPLKPGDYATLVRGDGVRSGCVKLIAEQKGEPGVWDVWFTDGPIDAPLCIGDRADSWTVGSVTPVFDEDGLPAQPGFYRDARKAVWKYDGELFSPVLSESGFPASAQKQASVGRERFLRESKSLGRFPFVKVKASFVETDQEVA